VNATPATTGFGWPPEPPAARPAAEPPPGPLPLPELPQAGAELRGAEFRSAAREIFREFTDELPRAADRDQAATLAAQLVSDWAARRVRDGGTVLSPVALDLLTQAVLDEQYGLGPLQRFADDTEVENVDINGPGHVWVRLRGGRKAKADPIAANSEDLIDLVRTWGLREAQTQREFSVSRPMLNAGLGGMVRLSAVMSVTRDVHVSVRFHRLVDITLDHLAGPPYLTLTPPLAHFLQAAVRAHKNILITGGVDAGKTTMLRALSSAVDPAERIATLESERELYLDLLPRRHDDVIAFESRQANSEGAGEITLHDLIPQALRMNPRRIIVGEVRDQEIRPMLEAMNSGQEGSMATIHANSANEIFNRILMLAQRGRMAMTTDAINLAVGLCRPFVLHIRKDRAGSVRHVSEVIEVLPPADGFQPSRNRIFSPGPDGRAVPDHSLSPEAMRDLIDAGFNPDVLTGGPS
jgi:Flp pilus assembly CpaF family ATPase